jgi:hypothetical protein
MDEKYPLIALVISGGVLAGLNLIDNFFINFRGTLLGKYVISNPTVSKNLEKHPIAMKIITSIPALLTLTSVYYQKKALQWQICLFTSSCFCCTALFEYKIYWTIIIFFFFDKLYS